MIQRVLNRSVFLNQFRRAFFSNSFCARNVIDVVAEQRHVIHHLFRRNAKNLLHLGFIHDHIALGPARAGAQHPYVSAYQLHHVFVVGDYQHVQLLFRSLQRQSAN